ncbi:hypothetical protein JHD47_00765 [Sulfurimonas sp. SAG-AH-194-L11]|nr:hypothetical protein [Sulfurimonas sp. SAG-AH-194-L11]MDF1876346.1 hypothetical protein [Sulfurimonas sp. SAG-AH-194-L11]
MKFTLLSINFFILLFFNACAPKQAMIKVDMLVGDGSYKSAAQFSDSKIDTNNLYAKNNLLWSLQSGGAYFYADENNSSIKYFDDSELIMKYYREQILSKDISQTIISTLLNDTTRPYIGTQYDGVMANTYKALSYMALQDKNAARVEFNRAIDRQRRAKIFFSEMINKERLSIEKKEQESKSEGKNLQVDKSLRDSLISQKYPLLHNYKPYPDFINPMTTYLAGLFAKTDGAKSKADSLLQEAYGMMPENENVKKELEEDIREDTVWLIFENGQAPVLKEWRIDFPIWIFTSRLSYISVALPKLVLRNKAYDYLLITDDTNTTTQTKFLSSMDRVIQTEFEKNYDATLRRAILSTATKAAINYTIQKQANNNSSGIAAFVSIASTIYQIASTQADTRSWTTLPKEFQLARFKRPKNGNIKIRASNNLLIKNIKIPDTQHTLIYVKIARPNAQASVKVIPF